MTRRLWYFYSLLTPFILPALIIFSAKISHRFLNGHSLLSWISLFALLQLTLGGLQYFTFLFFVYGWGKDKTEKHLFRASWALPLWFWPWCTLWLLILAHFMGRIKLFILAGLFSIPCGYFYVVLVHALGYLLGKAGLIVD